MATLGSIALVVMGQSPAAENVTSVPGGLPLLNGPTEFGGSHPVPRQYTRDARKRAEVGDLLFCVRGSTTGRMNWADQPYAIGRGLAAIRHREDISCQPYVRAVIEQQLADLLVAATGSTFPNVSRSQIENIQIPDLSLDEQRTISKILRVLSDKIEVNRRTVATLEDMARTVFRSWFVDFDPVRAKVAAKAEGRDPERAAMAALSGKSEADLDTLPRETLASLAALFPDEWERSLPSGWTESSLDQIARMVTKSVLPSKEPDAIFEHYSIPAYDEGNGPSLERGDSIKSGKYLVHEYAILVSKLNPNTPRIWMPSVKTDRAISSTEFMQFVPHEPKLRSFLYLLMQSEEMQEAVLGRVTGSTGSRQRAQPRQIATLACSLPPTVLMLQFCETVSPLLALATRLVDERTTLAGLRNALLPKLLDGSLAVSTELVGAVE